MKDAKLTKTSNGKLFSCEPCRRGKLRCDHNSPVCGRCARRNKPEQCIYHPAPLTKPRGPESTGVQKSKPPSRSATTVPYQPSYPATTYDRPLSGLVSPPGSTGVGAQQHDHSAFRPVNRPSTGRNAIIQPPPPVMAPTPTSGEDRRTSSSASYASPEGSMSFREGKIGFLGPTSYSSIFTENPASLGPGENEAVEDTPNLPPVSAESIKSGAEILALLRDIPLYEKFTQRWFDLCEGILVMQPAYRIWIDELWSEFGRLLVQGNPEQLRSLSELVWRNTRKPMKIHGNMTAREWAKAASGRNLRWEIVGIILTLAGLIATNLSNWDSIFDNIRDRYIDRASFAERMRKASEFCLCFCYESEVLNDLYVCFMYEDLILVECLKGDAHYAAWQRTGEVCDVIIALGLHQGNRVSAETPFFLAELRKKIFVSAYGRDKVTATFLGRPPRLSHRYCKMQEPLDLSDEDLFLEGAELEAALSQLDANGWNTGGTLCRTTWLRVWFQHCRIREDILEIALGSEEEDITYRSNRIRDELDRLHASYPAFMRISPEQVLEGSDVQVGKGWGFAKSELGARQVNGIFMICIHTGITYTEFLLQRAMINRRKMDYKDLIPISKRILKLVLLAQSRRDLFRDFQGDLIYLCTTHGLPTAGVLAIELLKQEQSRQYTPDILPRSETIQDLSVFISALGAVEPGEGNYSICNQGRRALKRVLDQILSPQPLPTTSAEQPAFDEMSLYFPTANDADFLQWLENVEWDKGNFMDAPPGSQGVAP
ncbi:hypothetical protein BAUCODRAFT_36555 [Baudoinia panamericana UAMH 10762]|uniref:Zn(2)-C6 fungal-type domain-containing protein n=1 Tax=Baudoinia panamericana (strain UAMH 10762) TaxID=717646 RepID=M2LIS0_BAUPA|nr:uncharacterized protein BAUCODRAFT_36555 [Baudoinia panamericana UAMH 10762]EMC94082.1 hypothetical protein BAUCODRAFT_36555 [Baudoinia panamericana UAMH 10762]